MKMGIICKFFCLMFCLFILTGMVSACNMNRVPYTTYIATSNQPNDVTFYATIIALQARGYFIEEKNMAQGKIVTRKRQDNSGKFWWVVNCTIQPDNNVLITLDSNLVVGATMHKRARNWIAILKNDIEGVILNSPPEEIRKKGMRLTDA